MAKWINKKGDMITTTNATYEITNKDGSGYIVDVSRWTISATSWIMNDIKDGYYPGFEKIKELDTTQIWMCVYCDTEMTNGTHCVPCNEYDGAMPKEEWEQFNRDNPRKKIGA